jgi:hypothetical protein
MMSQRTGDTSNQDGGQQVVDFTQARARKLDEKRRKTERIFFKHLLGVYTVAGGSQIRPIELIEVSEEGCSFQVPFDARSPWPTDLSEVPLRLYFSQDTYLPVNLRIINSSDSIVDGRRYLRFGCAVEPNTASHEAYVQFVRFLNMYSKHAHTDMGDVTVFYP